jgi:hypothetical protein
MTILLTTLAVAFAAFCVWLAVRIFNRRERWAKWTLAAAIGLPVLYVLSFGPACWITSRRFDTQLTGFYWPIGWVMLEGRDSVITDPLYGYGKLGMPRGSIVEIPTEFYSDYDVGPAVMLYGDSSDND